jgi:hypothetical protein
MGINKMKIAIIMTGHVKGWKRTYEGLQNHVLRHHDVDFYLSTWDVDNIGRNGTPNHYSAVDIEPVVQLYKPKKFRVENHNRYHQNRFPPIAFEEREDDVFKTNTHAIEHGRYWVERMRDMWYIIKQGYLLIDHPEEYDLIMRLRFDVVLDAITFQQTDVPIFLHVDLNKKSVYDLLAYGPPDLMKIYSHVFDHIESIYKNDNINIAHSDEMLGEYLITYNNIIPNGDSSIRFHGAWIN